MFVGRSDDLERLHELFMHDARLVTITGAGGIGKTRLAARYLELRGKAYAAAWTCDLSTASDAASITAEVARAIGMPVPQVDAAEAIGQTLATRGPVLLVLDNFEQIARHAPQTVRVWLALAKNARLLVTSREQLRLPAEIVHELAPLSLPEPGSDSDALKLWVSRVAAVRPGYSLTDAERPVAAQIVRELEGLPLAIELAAARTGMLGTREILLRLQDRFALLSHGPRDASDRQRTMRGVIDWSWQLLEPWEKDALAQSSAFVGGFTLEAAEHVLDLSAQSNAPPVLDVVQALRDKSLLVTRPETMRLTAYEMIREYGAARLAEGGTAGAVHARHAKYFAERAEAWAADFSKTGNRDAYKHLAVERDNLFAVADRAIGRGDRAMALRALVVLHAPFRRDGPLASYLARLDAATRNEEGVDRALLARALAVRGDIERSLGRMDASAATLERALPMARAAGAPEAILFALNQCGSFELCHGRLDAADAYYVEFRDLARANGRRRDEAVGEANLAGVMHERGLVAAAEKHYERALAIFRELGETYALAQTLHLLGSACVEQGRHAEGRAHLERASALSSEIGDRVTHGYTLNYLACSYMDEGKLGEAELGFARARDELRATGVKRLEGVTECYAGVVHLRLGRRDVAQEVLEHAAAILVDVADNIWGALALGFLAAAQASLDRVDAAETSLVLARAMQTSPAIHAAVDALEGVVDLARARRATGKAAKAFRQSAERRKQIDSKLVASSSDVRNALRVLEQALAEGTKEPGSIEVAEDGAWFRLPGGEPIACGARPVLKRLLSELAKRPRVPIAARDLVAVGWPGERMLEDAATNRLYVSMNRLRKLGLGALLVSTDAGYVLDAPVRVVAG
jgi:predicted ATPase